MRFAPIAAAFFCLSLAVSAQDLSTIIKNDPSLSSTVYQPYTPREGSLTRAPGGFKPFYISHYGRHGSRYYTGWKYFEEAAGRLDAMKQAGMLTEDGLKLYDEFITLTQVHDRMYGELTPRGAREHRAISQRMYERFGRVFRKRGTVNCVSTTVPRCIISMTNFTNRLQANVPSLNMSFTTGEKYFNLLCADYGRTGQGEYARHIADSLGRAISRYDKLFQRILKDPEAACKLLDDPYKLAHGIYIAGCICPDVDFTGTNLHKYFTADELASFVIPLNNRLYGDFGYSVEWGDKMISFEKALLRDFVDKADAALQEGSDVAADLRFGHDSGILPLLALMGIEGQDIRCRVADADKYWYAHEMVPMGTNLQLIFYRNCKGEVLVKMLYNEAETAIKAVPAYQGPYYRWEDLREWFVSRSK